MLSLESWQAFEFYKDFMRWYCKWYNPSYLEIGCASGELAATLNITRGMGVDINTHPDWEVYSKRHEHLSYIQSPSDVYFANNPEKFGLIFIDGDHSFEQVMKDVSNSLECLQDGGLICMHDTYPPTIEHTHPSWSGTAYKAAILLRQDPGLEVYTFPVTFGLTLVGKIGTVFPWTESESTS